MSIRTEIRQIEQHAKQLGSTKAEQIAIITKAQGLTKDERSLTILAIAKRRIINA